MFSGYINIRHTAVPTWPSPSKSRRMHSTSCCLTLMSEILTLGVMTETAVATLQSRRTRLFGPASGGRVALQPVPRRPAADGSSAAGGVPSAVAAANRAVLSTGTPAQVEGQVLAILAASKQRTVADLAGGETADDGSLAIDSMSAVFVCRIVAKVLGPHGWTRLRGNCEPDDFRSARSVSDLIVKLRREVAVA